MKPEVHDVLGVFAGSLLTSVTPEIESQYVRDDLALMAFLLMVSAEDYDRAAEVRVQDNRSMRTLFAAAAEHVADADLKQRLEEAANGNEASLRITDLNASNDALKRLLIEVHEHIETAASNGATWAHALDRKIWDILDASTQRRAISINPA